MVKKLLAIVLCVIMILSVLVGCGTDKKEAATVSKDSSSASKDASASPKKISIGLAIRTMDGAYYVAFANALKEYCDKEGWELKTLDAGNDISKETENMENLVTQGVDLIFLDCVDPSAAVANIDVAYNAGIPVINLDSGVGEGAQSVTTVYSDNLQNGRLVGKAYAETMDIKTPIKAIVISGNKGSIAGQQRRTGLLCGIIEERTGCTEEKAWEMAKKLEQDVTDKGKGENKEANFIVAGQGWGNWNEDGGLKAAEDLISANKDLNCVLGENDNMLFGAMKALDNANISYGENGIVKIVAAADGAKDAYDKIKEGTYFATGENSPSLITQKGVEIAKEILISGKDPKSYEEITMTKPAAVTKGNVDEHYNFGF